MSQTLAATAATAATTGRRGAAATSRTAPGPGAAPRAARPRPALRVVRAPAVERGRTVFAVTCLLLLVTGLLSLLLINTALAQGSFTLHDLQARSAELGDREQALRQDIDVQAAPARLAARASALGMVPSQSPAFLRLSDGRLLGVAAPAKAPARPTVAGQAKTASSAGRAGSAPSSASSTKGPKAKNANQTTNGHRARGTSKPTTTKPTTTKSG